MSTTKTFTGSPTDIGGTVFIDIAMPVIAQASKQMDAKQLVQLYSGFVGAAFGCLEADFGKDMAAAIALQLAQSYAAQPPIDERPVQ